MDCQFAFLCDYGQESGGKLHALGVGWDTIYAGTLPARHPMMCFIARLSGTIVEAGTKELGIRIIDADGLDIVPPISQAIPFDAPCEVVASLQNFWFDHIKHWENHRS